MKAWKLTVQEEWERARAAGDAAWEEEILDRYRNRMGDLAGFMKDLKQRFSQWHNRRQGRKGTLWEDRYKSVLVEGLRDRQSIRFCLPKSPARSILPP